MDCFFIVYDCRVRETFSTFRFSCFLHVSFFKTSTFRFAGFRLQPVLGSLACLWTCGCVGRCGAVCWPMRRGVLADAARCVGRCGAVCWLMRRGVLADARGCAYRSAWAGRIEERGAMADACGCVDRPAQAGRKGKRAAGVGAALCASLHGRVCPVPHRSSYIHSPKCFVQVGDFWRPGQSWLLKMPGGT